MMEVNQYIFFLGYSFGRQLNLLLLQLLMSNVGRQKVFNSSKTYSNKSFKTNQDSHNFCSLCKESNDQLHNQITTLKDKAHQSFMQVLQIQQLHQEQILQLREEEVEKQAKYMGDIERLQRQVGKLRGDIAVLERNVRRHNYDMGQRELVIENIDAIICEEGENSYLDESQLMQFKEIVSVRNGNDYVASLRKQIYKDIKFISNNKTQIEKLFILIKELKDQNTVLLNKNQELSKKYIQSDHKVRQLKLQFQNLIKQQKFMSEHIKRLGNDKLKLQKKITQLQKIKTSEQKTGRPQFINLNLPRNTKSYSPSTPKEYPQTYRNMLSSVLEQSKINQSQYSVSQRQVNELNYAKFMVVQEVNEVSQSTFYRKQSK